MKEDRVEELMDIILEAFGYDRFDLEENSYKSKLRLIKQHIGQLATKHYVNNQILVNNISKSDNDLEIYTAESED